MVNISLTIGERLLLRTLLSQFGIDLTLLLLKISLKIADKVEVSEEEAKKVGLDRVSDTRVKWDDEQYEKEIEFSDEEMAFIKAILRKKDKSGKFQHSEGKIILSIVDKIGGIEDEK